MDTIQHNLSQALQVITRDVKIRAFLEANDPNALVQAEDALRGEYADFDSTIHRDADSAFENAIAKKMLFDDENEYNWVGHYMYMYSQNKNDFFKHINTRNYVKVAYAF